MKRKLTDERPLTLNRMSHLLRSASVALAHGRLATAREKFLEVQPDLIGFDTKRHCRNVRDLTNDIRAAYGADAARYGSPDFGENGETDNTPNPTSLSDALANLMHFAREERLDFNLALQNAQMNFKEEVKEESETRNTVKRVTQSSEEIQRAFLKELFPWLGTDEPVSGADVVDTLNLAYESLTSNGAKPKQKAKPAKVPKVLTCPHCGNKSKDADSFRVLANDVVYRSIVSYKKGKLVAEGQRQSYDEESEHDDRLECRECYEEFPIPAGVEVDYI